MPKSFKARIVYSQDNPTGEDLAAAHRDFSNRSVSFLVESHPFEFSQDFKLKIFVKRLIGVEHMASCRRFLVFWGFVQPASKGLPLEIRGRYNASRKTGNLWIFAAESNKGKKIKSKQR